ncbi:sugar ABC transporter substrate-binding protein [Phytomonospora endophytica]|uniref:D-xylose transport system substrate-binding protein n=1 Tax=Phytomonospora endophytica TaxID=714109 RepID=A0A841FLC1_9ACTN|nr:substrate-binding domain-containing protein [Phytomonospora endophytica]MBB6036956.1 D-xylose transport system substrate-binding protein [Phytomonospora endophytica]GIG68013.1 sugar ABC transporter substrate-binding protein [Phytomonospora endophytica]
MRRFLTIAAAGLLAFSGLTACGQDDDGGTTKTPKIGVILPDSKSSARWETADRKFLAAAFEAAGVEYDIQNAQNDKTAFGTIADQMITNGATVLMIVNLDSGTGKAVIEKARSQGVATIDYDRLTLGGNSEYYVSFDNEKVGQLQGEGLVKCLADAKVDKPVVAELNGSATDNNATQFKAGYDSVLQPLYDSGEFVKGPDESVPEWNNTQAGTIFEQMLTSTSGKIDGVLAANDGLAHAVISLLEKNNLKGKVPVTGQDATVQALQHILAGEQCMTVYKAVKKEADAAAELAIALANGEKKTTSQTTKDPESGRDVPSVLLDPLSVTADNVKAVVDDGYVTVAELCVDDYAELCTKAGIS